MPFFLTANIALKHRTEISDKNYEKRNDGKTDLPAAYGAIQRCFNSKWSTWRVMFGGRVRFAMVCILKEDPNEIGGIITIDVFESE